MDFKFRRGCSVKFATTGGAFRPSPRRQFDINFTYLFTYKTSKLIQCQHSNAQCLIQSGSPPPHRASAALPNAGKSPSPAEIGKAVGRAVRGRLDGRELDELIEHVCKEVREVVGEAPPFPCLLELSFRVSIEDRDVCRLPAALRLVDGGEGDVDKEEERKCCSICLENLGDGGGDGRILGMECLHVFHGGCIVKWLEESRSCPLCRREMPPAPEEIEIGLKN